MAHYLIGDLQGCNSALAHLLDKIDFSPSRDTLFVLGDLVNRGPESLAVLERLMHYGDAARCLLGNHDLNLLAIAYGVRQPHRKDTLTQILQSPRLTVLINWLRQQRLAMLHSQEDIGKPQTPQASELLMVHAGVLPSWTATKTIALAAEVETVLRHATTTELREFFQDMYGDTPTQWHDGLTGQARLRVIVNALTRLRFCSADGTMEFKSKDNLDAVPAGYLPWFDVPGRATADITVAFGHWSTLGWLNRPDVLALDGGCVWGGCLNALRLSDTNQATTEHAQHELIQVHCEQAQQPG
ncbi:MAG: symmetrical bis(5'-nucleosyl)-tetraphosphatase [Burkholderiaceae bacterium]|nr:symmetrical bis(5'-nucleosyl)-tetraphosphatase [Burkholderiaceae bacterium]